MARGVIVGGGLAGATAALLLAEAGHDLLLVEKRARLGGRATSFRPPGWDRAVDNSQHVLLRCCTHLLELYRRLGVDQEIDWHDRIRLVAGDRSGCFRSWPLPPPLHLAPAVGSIPGLPPASRLKLAAAFGRMMLAGRRHRSLDHQTFAAWLGGLRDPVLDHGFWRLMLTSVLNADADRISAAYGLMFFLEGLLRHREAYHLGVPRLTLDELHHDRMLAALTERGVEVRLRDSARVDLAGGALEQVTIGGEPRSVDFVVSAVPWRQLPRTVRGLDPRLLRPLGRLRAESIVGVHLRFAEPVIDDPVVGFLDSDVDWVFGQDGGRRLSVVASDARGWAGLSPAAMAARAMAALRRQWPGLPEPEATAACRETTATFVPAPGSEPARPGATAVPGLVLAGEWTATGWPSTMEGAVRSGYAAAAAVTGRDESPGDLPREGMMRWALRR